VRQATSAPSWPEWERSFDSASNAANNLRATATIDAGALANGGVSGGADLTVGDASAGIGAGLGIGAGGIGIGAGGYIDPSDLSISGGTDGSGALSASLQMNADASMPELASALSGMGAQMRAIGSQAANLSETLQKDVQAISDKLDEISTTVFDAMDSLENRDLVTDGSQTDPESITMGALRGCENTGAVQADRNVGGIAGAMGMEAGADPESDVSQSLSTTERKQYELRAVLQRCVSTGAVTAKKDCAAAICGRMDLGLIDGCEAYGSVESQSGDYAGGVAGICSAAIENCWAKCALSGGRYVGGITGTGVTDSVTGSGSTVSGCVSLVSITGYSQYAGAISGSSAGAFADNLFVSDTLAGLDGASAAGQAEPVSYEALLENEALPDAFRTFTVQFVAGEEVLKTVEVNYGESLPDSVYPDIPAVDGQYGEWDVQTLENIQFDTTVTAQYHASIDALPQRCAACRRQARLPGRGRVYERRPPAGAAAGHHARRFRRDLCQHPGGHPEILREYRRRPCARRARGALRRRAAAAPPAGRRRGHAHHPLPRARWAVRQAGYLSGKRKRRLAEGAHDRDRQLSVLRGLRPDRAACGAVHVPRLVGVDRAGRGRRCWCC